MPRGRTKLLVPGRGSGKTIIALQCLMQRGESCKESGISQAPNSAQAIANLKALCGTHLPDRHLIEVADVFKGQGRALADGYVSTLALFKSSSRPGRKIIGTSNQTGLVLAALGLEPTPA